MPISAFAICILMMMETKLRCMTRQKEHYTSKKHHKPTSMGNSADKGITYPASQAQVLLWPSLIIFPARLSPQRYPDCYGFVATAWIIANFRGSSKINSSSLLTVMVYQQ